MKNIIRSGFLFSIVALASCYGKQEARARIIERKEVGKNRILIKYKYEVNGAIQLDSAIIDNTVINRDTINVSYYSDRPEKSIPVLNK